MIDFFGLFTVDTLYVVIGMGVVIIGLLALSIVNTVKLKKMGNNYKKFMAGKKGRDLEAVILEKFEEIDKLNAANDEKTAQINEIFDALRLTYSKTGIIKYDAFNEMGGKLSFALALLDNRNNGFVINAMHSREGCYTYVKEIINGESYITLGDEEKKAIDKAINHENAEE